MDTELRIVEIDGKRRLAVFTGIEENTPALARQFAMSNRRAWRITDGVVYAADCIALRKIDGQVAMIFPDWEPVASLREIIRLPGNVRLSYLNQLAAALASLAEHKDRIGTANPDAVFFIEDGIVILDKELSAVLDSHKSSSVSEPAWLEDIRDTSWSFALAYLCYEAITGRLPFPGTNREERLFARERGYLIKLKAKSESARAFVVWIERALKLYNMFVVPPPFPENLTEEISPAETPEKLEKITAGRYRLSRKIAKYGLPVTISAVVLIFLAAIITPMIKAATRPPVTIGLDAYEVAKLYYKSINDMDIETLGDCLASKKDPAYIMLTNLFVTSRVRTAVEKQSPIVSPDTWKSYGMPKLDEGTYIFGISNLELEYTSKGKNTAIIEADYLFWTMDIPEEELAEPLQIVKQVKERLVMDKVDDRWVISSHKPTEESLIELDKAISLLDKGSISGE